MHTTSLVFVCAGRCHSITYLFAWLPAPVSWLLVIRNPEGIAQPVTRNRYLSTSQAKWYIITKETRMGSCDNYFMDYLHPLLNLTNNPDFP